MKAYVNPAASRNTHVSASAAGPLDHIAVGAAARLGAIACGLAWLLAGIVVFICDLFGINLLLTVFEARWVASAGWESLPVFMAEFGGLVAGTVGASLFGALTGALTAWTYNLTSPAPIEELDD